MALSEDQRRREEDPYTERWVTLSPTQLVGLQSRFEIDLNRPREKAVYLSPADAWGLHVWTDPPSDEIRARSLEQYDRFYRRLQQLVAERIARHGRVVVFDLHSYNHHRLGPTAPYDDPASNPQVNIGTSNMDMAAWGKLVDAFTAALSVQTIAGQPLDVRGNVKFRGGNMVQWLHGRFGSSVCALAIEVKKFFMDEWTGLPNHDILAQMAGVLRIAALTVEDRLT